MPQEDLFMYCITLARLIDIPIDLLFLLNIKLLTPHSLLNSFMLVLHFLTEILILMKAYFSLN